jgi:hypothetical protein
MVCSVTYSLIEKQLGADLLQGGDLEILGCFKKIAHLHTQ